jgi:hypothetical protein
MLILLLLKNLKNRITYIPRFKKLLSEILKFN